MFSCSLLAQERQQNTLMNLIELVIDFVDRHLLLERTLLSVSAPPVTGRSNLPPYTLLTKRGCALIQVRPFLVKSDTLSAPMQRAPSARHFGWNWEEAANRLL